MSGRQRIVNLAIAAVIAVVAVVVILASSGGDDVPEREAGATPAPTQAAAPGKTPAATPEPTPTADPVPELRVEEGEVVGGVQELEFAKGERVRFSVTSDVADEVHVHAYDFMKDVEAGATVRFDFPATITGIIEVELEASGIELAELRVDP